MEIIGKRVGASRGKKGRRFLKKKRSVVLYEGGERLNKSKCASQRGVVFFSLSLPFS